MDFLNGLKKTSFTASSSFQFWLWQIVTAGFVLVFPICLPDCLHPSNNREPILAGASPGCECRRGFRLLRVTQNTLVSLVHLVDNGFSYTLLHWHGAHPLCNIFSVMTLSVVSLFPHACALKLCALWTICAPPVFSVILLTVFDFLQGKLLSEGKETFVPRGQGSYFPGNVGGLHLTKSTFHMGAFAGKPLWYYFGHTYITHILIIQSIYSFFPRKAATAKRFDWFELEENRKHHCGWSRSSFFFFFWSFADPIINFH